MDIETPNHTEVPATETEPLTRTLSGNIQKATGGVLGTLRNGLALTGIVPSAEVIRRVEITRGRDLAKQGKWYQAAKVLGKANDMEGVRILMEAAAQAPDYIGLCIIAKNAGVHPPKKLLIETGETALKYANFPDKYMAKCALEHAGVDPVHLSTVYHLDGVSYKDSMKRGNPIGESQRQGQKERMKTYIETKLQAAVTD